MFNDVITFPVGEGSFSLGLSQLDTEATYTVKYEFECYPKINGKTSEDSFVLRRAHTIEDGAISAGKPIDAIE